MASRLFFVGGLLAWWLEKKHPQLSQEFTFPVASGWIAGDSLIGVALVTTPVMLPPDCAKLKTKPRSTGSL